MATEQEWVERLRGVWHNTEEDEDLNYFQDVDFKWLVGQTIAEMVDIEFDDNDAIIIKTDVGDICRFWCAQECDTSVTLVDKIGDYNDIIGSPIVSTKHAQEYINPDENGGDTEFNAYEIQSQKGYVHLRFQGQSNGFYGVTMQFAVLMQKL